MTRQGVEPGSPEFLAIERALEAAELRAGDALGSSASIESVAEPSAAELGDVAGGAFDGDGD